MERDCVLAHVVAKLHHAHPEDGGRLHRLGEILSEIALTASNEVVKQRGDLGADWSAMRVGPHPSASGPIGSRTVH